MSTSTLGREERKPLEDAFILQRRILLGCTSSIGIGCIIWIIAISTDSWSLGSGGEKGIYLPKEQKYFMSFCSGIWEQCDTYVDVTPFKNSSNVRNFTQISYSTTSSKVEEFKNMTAQKEYIKEFLRHNITNTSAIDDKFKQKMFAEWITNNKKQFELLKNRYISKRDNSTIFQPVHFTYEFVDASNKEEVREKFGDALSTVIVDTTILNFTPNNFTTYSVVVPLQIRDALFDNWESKKIMEIINRYATDMEIPFPIHDGNKRRLFLIPPTPPKTDGDVNGYTYTKNVTCVYHDLFPSNEELAADPNVDDTLTNYIQSAATFSSITLLVMLMGFFFSLYTFLNPRYMFKRLAGGIHFISGMTSIVVAQVLSAGTEYEEKNLSVNFPYAPEYSYGFGLYLAYIVVAINLFSAIMFMAYSRKKKGEKAHTEELGMADEAINIGR